MKKVLITGGAGFIGLALAKKLHNDNYNVTILDLKEKFNSTAPIVEIPRIVADIRNYSNLEPHENNKYDHIFHFAAQTSGAISQEEPELDVETNVKGTLNICNFARKTGASKITFSSSMGVYGDHQEAINESTLISPISNYGVSKVAGEFYVKMFHQFDIDYTVFRIFNAYGPGQDMTNMRQGMASIFMAQLIQNNKIEVTGSLTRYRDFVFISDIIDAMVLSIDHLHNDIYNIGSGFKTTVAELIHLLLKVAKRNSNEVKVINIGKHEGDQFGTYSDCSKLLTEGWRPKIDFESGLKKMYKYALSTLSK